MFEKFGEFNSVEELNAAAAGFLKEGDEESVFALAQENGLEREDAEDYVDGIVPELATRKEAALGRLAIQREHIVKNNKDMAERMAYGVMLSMLQTMCTEEKLAAAVMQKGKTVEDIYKAMREEAGKHASGTGQNRYAVSCGTDQELRDIIRAYYLEPKKLKHRIAALYVIGEES